MANVPGGDGWRAWELDLRKREVKSQEVNAKSQGRAAVMQVMAVLVAAFAAASAGWGAWQAARAASIAQQEAASQAAEGQFATAISAIGDQSVTAQVAGLTLLRRNVKYQMQMAAGHPDERQSAYDAYATSLDIIAVYLRENSRAGRAPQARDVYAADELKLLLGMAQNVNRVRARQLPSIDLTSVGLAGVSLPKVNFSWLGSAFMPGIDLSGADLLGSRWGNATLRHADLRCADLQGADLRRANLTGADLRGANLSGARLPARTAMKGVNAEGAFGGPAGLPDPHPALSWQFGDCKS